MKKYIIILIASVMATVVTAQDLTPQEEREFYQKVYELFNKYAQSAAVSDDEEEMTFQNVFVNSELEIQNDLMNLSREPKLTVEEYVQTIQKARSVKVLVKNIKKDGDVEDAGETWNLPVVFEKGITFSKDGAFFDSYDYFGGYYRLRAVVSLNKSSGECYIKDLGADPKHDWKDFVFPEKFTVLERTPKEENPRNYKRDNNLTIDGRDVHWNRYNQVMLRPGQEQKIRYNDNDVEIKEMSKMSNGGSKIRAYYNDKSFRIRANMGYSLSGFNKLTDGASSIQTPTDNEMSFGLDFGYVLPSTSKFYCGIFVGVGLSSNNLKMAMTTGDEISVACPNEADEDGEAYTRHYVLKGSGITQELKASDITIPIYADFEYQLIPMLSAYADLGLRVQMSSGKWTANIDGYETFGQYKNYNNLKIKGDVNLNGFGNWNGGDIDVDETGWSAKTSINALMGAGLRLNLTKSFAFDAGVQYLMGGNCWEGSKGDIFSYTLPQNAKTPAEKAKGDKVNLLNKTGGIKHNALRVVASLIYKF